jgi:hypothetical protein
MRLEPFCRYTATAHRPDFAGATPVGRRVVAPVSDARWAGPAFAASQRGVAAADWLVTSAEGVAMPDVRMALRTDDGAFLYVEYRGRADWSGGPGTGLVRAMIAFETEDERYRWMNSTFFVAEGGIDTVGGVAYDVFSLH